MKDIKEEILQDADSLVEENKDDLQTTDSPEGDADNSPPMHKDETPEVVPPLPSTPPKITPPKPHTPGTASDGLKMKGTQSKVDEVDKRIRVKLPDTRNAKVRNFISLHVG